MDPPNSKAPLCLDRFPHCGASTIVEGNVSGSFHFSRVLHHDIDDHDLKPLGRTVSLAPLYGLSPVTVSLSVCFSNAPSSQVFYFVYSFPRLEDLHLIIYNPWIALDDDFVKRPTAVSPPCSPPFTSTLKLDHRFGMFAIAP